MKERYRTRKKRKAKPRSQRLTRSQRQKIHNLRISIHLSVEELAEKAGVGIRWLKNVESTTYHQCRFETSYIERLAKALNLTLPQLFDDTVSVRGSAEIPTDFESLSKLSHEVDSGVMPLVRNLTVPTQMVEEAYGDLMHERCRKHGFDLSEFLRTLHTRRLLTRLLNTVPTADLVVDVGDRFQYVQYTHRNISIKLHHPKLLWDCHCKTPRAKNMSKCPIHRCRRDGDEIAARMRGGNVLFRYRGLRFLWRQRDEFWPPSIDTFVMLLDLEREGLLQDEYQSLLDLGSGTGILGTAIVKANPHVVRLDMSDWLLTPVLYSLVNWQLNRQGREYVEVNSHLGFFSHILGRGAEQYDVVICNPPYLPLLKGYEDLGMYKTVAGTDLLTHVISVSRALGKRVFIQFSHLAAPEVKMARTRAKVRLRPLNRSRKVPFRVQLSWKMRGYLQKLKRERELIEEPAHRHRYWHNIRTYEIISESE